jgi:hypothetical protein
MTEGTATAETPDQGTQSAPVAGDTASPELPAENNEAQNQPAEGAEAPSDEAKLLAELPPALRTRYNQVFTQKAQKYAEERKRYEPYAQLIASLEQDPLTTIKALAERAQLIKAPEPGERATDSYVAKLAAIVGEEEAGRLAPILKEVAKEAIAEEVKPLKAHQEYVSAEFAREQTATVMKAFSDKYPGWEKYESKMLEFSNTLQPNGMDEGAYLEALYKLATYGVQSAEQTKAIVEKMQKSAAASESVSSGVNASRVAPGPRKYKDTDEALREAAAAARRGEVWG